MEALSQLVIADTLTVFNPQAPGTQSGVTLGWIVTIVCTAIFLVVAGIILFAMMRYRWREGEADPKQSAGNKTVEIVWTAIPLVIVIFLFTLTVRTMGVADPAPPADPDLVVTGHQWWWEAQYPKSGVITANEIHIPTHKPIAVLLKSADVLHEFWVAELTRKMTTVPGQPNHIWIEADTPGTYLGVCSEFCGTQHAWMRFKVIAEDPDKFDEWQKSQLQPAPEPAPATPEANGEALYRSMSCTSCHTIANKGGPAGGRVEFGPDLTHFASRLDFGSGISKNTPENLHRWLKNPQDVKPG
ncbi:MAG TPA: cytochrome c oxidase subunit II, partial [Chthoniobacteraceae bacterium]|nr:cytochrome c oxidase subunit II [Chthoniobacteraceae bacterium]